MLGRDHDVGVLEQVAPGQPVDHQPQLAVDEAERVPQHRPRHPAAAAVQVSAGALDAVDRREGQLLGGRDRLEVHAEDARHAGMRAAAVVAAVDLVQDRPHLDRVVELGVAVVRGPVGAGPGRQRGIGCGAVDLGREQVVDGAPGVAADQLIGRVLVGPRCAHAGIVGDLEDGVHAQVLPRVDRLAGGGIDRQLAGVDHPLLDLGDAAGQRKHAGGEARVEVRDAGAGVDRVQVAIQHLGEVDLGAEAAGLAGRARAAGWQQAAVVAVVVVDARGARVAAGDLGDETGEGVGGDRGGRVGVLRAAVRDPCQHAVGVVADPPAQIGLVQSVHRDQEHVLGGFRGGRLRRARRRAV